MRFSRIFPKFFAVFSLLLIYLKTKTSKKYFVLYSFSPQFLLYLQYFTFVFISFEFSFIICEMFSFLQLFILSFFIYFSFEFVLTISFIFLFFCYFFLCFYIYSLFFDSFFNFLYFFLSSGYFRSRSFFSYIFSFFFHLLSLFILI